MNRRQPIILFAACLFGGLAWLSVSMGERYQITLTAPLTIEDVPEGYAIRTPVPRTLLLRYRGDGWRLALLQFGADANLTMSFISLRPAGEAPGRADSGATSARPFTPPNRIITHLDISERAPTRAGVELTDITPDSIVLALDRYQQRKVPLLLDVSTSFREGYGQVGTVTLAPESVTVGGAASIVRTITSWSTVRREFKDLRTPVEADVALTQSPLLLLTFSVPSTHVSLNVEPFAEKVLSGITVEGRSVPQHREVIFIPPKVDIVTRGGIRQLANLSAADFHVSIEYASILADTTGSIDPAVAGPGGIQVVTKRPDRVQYIVRKRL